MAGNLVRQAVVPTAPLLKNERREHLVRMLWILFEKLPSRDKCRYRLSGFQLSGNANLSGVDRGPAIHAAVVERETREAWKAPTHGASP